MGYLDVPQPMLVEHFEMLATRPEQSGVENLRKLILTLAVQGKLVPQDSNDLPARELLRQTLPDGGPKDAVCRASPPIADDEAPFDLPAGWVWVRLGEVWRSSFYGPRFSTEEYVSSRGIPTIRTTDMSNGEIILKDPPCVMVLPEKLEAYRLEYGDLLVTRSGSIGTMALFKLNIEAVPSAYLIRIRLSAAVVPEYCLNFFLSQLGQSQLGLSTTSVGVPNVSASKMAQFMFPLPPAQEQFRIATRVKELMRLCDALEAKGRLEAEQHARLLSTLLDTLTDSTTPEDLAANWQRVATHFDLLLDRPEAVDTLEQTILQLAVRGLLVPRDPTHEPAHDLMKRLGASDCGGNKTLRAANGTEAFDIQDPPCSLPESWCWARFEHIAQIASNLVDPARHLTAWQIAPDCIEKRTGRLLSRRSVAEAGVKSANHKFAAGQLLYSKIRPSLSKVVQVDFEGLCSADMYPINAHIDAAYLHLYMLSDLFLQQVAMAENRVKMPKLNQEALNGFLVAVPPLEEQFHIVARVTELRSLCADLRQRLSNQQSTQARLAEALVEQAVAT